MIIEFIWNTRKTGRWVLPSGTAYARHKQWRGWFVLGFIPLYIKNTATEYTRD